MKFIYAIYLKCQETNIELLKSTYQNLQKNSVETYEITDDNIKFKVLAALADSYCRTILQHTKNNPKSAMELAFETNIPISTIYRRLQNLFDLKLLSIAGSISEQGKKFFVYQNNIDAIHTSSTGETIKVRISKYAETNP